MSESGPNPAIELLIRALDTIDGDSDFEQEIVEDDNDKGSRILTRSRLPSPCSSSLRMSASWSATWRSPAAMCRFACARWSCSITTSVQQRVRAPMVSPDVFFFRQRDRIVASAVRHALSAIYASQEFP